MSKADLYSSLCPKFALYASKRLHIGRAGTKQASSQSASLLPCLKATAVVPSTSLPPPSPKATVVVPTHSYISLPSQKAIPAASTSNFALAVMEEGFTAFDRSREGRLKQKSAPKAFCRVPALYTNICSLIFSCLISALLIGSGTLEVHSNLAIARRSRESSAWPCPLSAQADSV